MKNWRGILRLLIIIPLFLLPRGTKAGEVIPTYINMEITGTKKVVKASIGEGLRIRWEEKGAPIKQVEEIEVGEQWPSSRQFGLDWKFWAPWRPYGNWHVWNWMKVKIGGNVDGIWNGRLRTAGKCNHKGYGIVDFFWVYPQGDLGNNPGLIHARFMRNRRDEYLYCRLDIPEPKGSPIRIILAAMPYDYPTRNIYENILYAPRECRVTYRRIGLRNQREEAWENIQVGNSSPMVLARGIDFLHGGAGLIYFPGEIESIRSPSNWRDVVVELTLSPGVHTVHLGFWEYINNNAQGAMKKLLEDQALIRETLRLSEWQHTKPNQIIDLEDIRKRYEELFSLKSISENFDAILEIEELEREANTLFVQTKDLIEKNKVITDAETLCQLYKQRDVLLKMERQMQEWFLGQIEKGKLP